MPVVGMGRTTGLLSTHSSQLPEHGITSAFVSPLLSTVAISATTIGQAVGAISSSITHLPPAALPMPASMAVPSKQVTVPRPDVVCPLPNPDGSACRKKCSGTFAYRSICEHIRRAHPDHWIPKLPASAESFRKMIQTPPNPRGADVHEVPSGTGGTQSSVDGATPRRTTTGSSQRPRAKAPRSKPSPDGQDLVGSMPSQTSSPESHSQVTPRTQAEPKELLAHVIPQQSMPSETDTESDHTRSPSSPSLLISPTPLFPIQSYKATSVAKPKSTSSRKKSSSSSGSKPKPSPRKIPARRRIVDKKTSSTALAALYSTPIANHSDPAPLAAEIDMMDVDTEPTARQHYVFSHQTGDLRSGSRHPDRGDELDSGGVGLSLGSMSKAPQHMSDANLGAPQLRRSFSFSVGDRNGPVTVASGARTNRGLSLNTAIPFEPDRWSTPMGPMSAGGIRASVPTGGSRWDDLLEAAGAAAEENRIPEKKSPLLCQSTLPHIPGEPCVSRQNMNPYGPDLPTSLKVMIDIATAEADLNQIHQEQRQIRDQHHTHPQNYAHTQHWYTPPTSMYQQHSYGNQYRPYHYYSGNVSNHTAISILNDTSLASLNSSNATSHASTPAYSKPSSPRAETVQYLPKIQCSLCRVHVEISMAFACTECINGFCHQCVPSSEISEHEGGGLSGLREMTIGSPPELEPQTAKHVSEERAVTKEKNQGAKCGVCGVAGARYKPVRLIVHV